MERIKLLNSQFTPENKDEKIARSKLLAPSYYARKDVQEAIYNFCKNRETVPNFNMQSYGKRPDMLDYPSDILLHVKKGATSFHCSEEIWQDPMEINTDMTPEQYNKIKTGWDFLIDIDSKYLDYSKIAAKLIIQALEHHKVKNIGIKFSGSKGFHLIIPWKAFPQELNNQQTKDMFPEWPRLIAGYIDELIHDRLIQEILQLSGTANLEKKGKQTFEVICNLCNQKAIPQKSTLYKCSNCKSEMQKTQITERKGNKTIRCPSCNFDMNKIREELFYVCNPCQTNSNKNPEQFEKKPTAKQLIDSVDIVLVASRHLFRAPYSLHEKTCLASIPISKDKITDFNPHDADPLKLEIKNFYPNAEPDEAKELLIQALDWAKKEPPKEKKFTGESIDLKGLTISEDTFPPSIQKILRGIKQDGRKRCLSLLLSFYSALEFPQEYIEEKIEKWNKKNYTPLKQGYIKSQIDWHSKNRRLPPNYDKPIYRELALLAPGEGTKVKNPINHTIREALRNKNKKKNAR